MMLVTLPIDTNYIWQMQFNQEISLITAAAIFGPTAPAL